MTFLALGENGGEPVRGVPESPIVSRTRARTPSSVTSESGQCLGGETVTLGDEPEQDVLGADEGVVEQACFFLGEAEDPARAVGEPLKREPVWHAPGVTDRRPTPRSR